MLIKTIQTVLYIVDLVEKRILLGRKRYRKKKVSGLGIGKLDGYGGDFDKNQDDTIEDTALRETWEECGLMQLD